MGRKETSGIMLTLLLINMLTLAFSIQPLKAEPGTIIVPDDYSTIQQAVDAANSGDTIYVRAETYYERVYISGRSHLNIVGEDCSNTTVHTLDSAPGPFNVHDSDNITITGFTVATVGYGIGIDLWASQYCKITGNRILQSDCNIALQNDCHHNLVSNNVLVDGFEGIYLFSSWGAFPSTNNTMSDNNITSMFACINIEYCDDNLIIGNTLSSTEAGYSAAGIMISGSVGCFLRDNNITGDFPFAVYGESVSDYIHDVDMSNRVDGKPICYWTNEWDKHVPGDAGLVYVVNSTNIGISDLSFEGQASAVNLIAAHGSTIQNITATACRFGVNLVASHDNTVDANRLHSNVFVGLELGSSWGSSKNNTISRNNITNNPYGVQLSICSGNKFYHNSFVGNTQQVCIIYPGYVNIWDDWYPSGGNYWSDYAGTDLYSGLHQNVTGSDGVGDTPYAIDGDNIDHYPLMNPWTPPDIAIVDLTTSKTGVSQGFNLEMNVTVHNEGNKIEALNVSVFYDDTIIIQPDGKNYTDATLTSGSSTTLTMSWNTTGTTCGNYTISANVIILPGETDTTDNTFTDGWIVVTVVGDINCDFKVDIKDLVLVIKHYATIPGYPLWNPNADINCDGKVDIKDLVLVIRHFGEHCP